MLARRNFRSKTPRPTFCFIWKISHFNVPIISLHGEGKIATWKFLMTGNPQRLVLLLSLFWRFDENLKREKEKLFHFHSGKSCGKSRRIIIRNKFSSFLFCFSFFLVFRSSLVLWAWNCVMKCNDTTVSETKTGRCQINEWKSILFGWVPKFERSWRRESD